MESYSVVSYFIYACGLPVGSNFCWAASKSESWMGKQYWRNHILLVLKNYKDHGYSELHKGRISRLRTIVEVSSDPTSSHAVFHSRGNDALRLLWQSSSANFSRSGELESIFQRDRSTYLTYQSDFSTANEDWVSCVQLWNTATPWKASPIRSLRQTWFNGSSTTPMLRTERMLIMCRRLRCWFLWSQSILRAWP